MLTSQALRAPARRVFSFAEPSFAGSTRGNARLQWPRVNPVGLAPGDCVPFRSARVDERADAGANWQMMVTPITFDPPNVFPTVHPFQAHLTIMYRVTRRAISVALLPVFVVAALPGFLTQAGAADAKLRALIIDGQNNHTAWPQTTMMTKKYLEDSGRFTVDIERTQFTWKGGKLLEQFPLKDGKTYQDLPQPKTDPDFKPKFSDYDVVISNFGWNAAPWPQETQKALEDFVDGGGGLVVIHAADNSFAEWNEFNKMIGIGGWGGRNEQSGPYVYINLDGEVIRDTTAGPGGNHGPAHEYQVIVRTPDHPIVKGLPSAWMHTKDELYQKLRGPAVNMTILATAYADPKYKGTGRHEPKLMTIDYGKGRIFHTTMGHDAVSFSGVGFITTLVRGCEWAATGDVTLTDVPEDFPSPTESSAREF